VSAESGGQGAGRLLRPGSIAIVGVSPEPDSIGGAVLANLERFKYGGVIHLVSRSRDAIGGRPCLPAIDELPEGVDAAVLALPQAGIAEAVASCIKRKIGAAVIFAAGFAEIGDAGRIAQDKLARAAKAGGLALQGPNCIGFVNYADGVPLTYEPVTPAQPNGPAVAIAAQSGAMASSLRAAFQAKGLAVAQAISTGNEAGLCVEDFLEFLVGESNAKAIALFVEQIRQPKRFLELAARARQAAKAIVLLHPGRGARAKDSARSHTGALAGDYAVMETLLRRQAVALVETVEELIDVTEILARFPQAPVKGAAIVTNSGAFKGFALDFCESIGLDLPAPSAATVAALKKALPPFASIDNPLDVTGQLDKATQAQLSRGQRLTEILKQDQFAPFSVQKQVLSLFVATSGAIDNVPVDQVRRFESEFIQFVESSYGGILKTIAEKQALDDGIKAEIKKAADSFKERFMASIKDAAPAASVAAK